jgi:hypothetical protein
MADRGYTDEEMQVALEYAAKVVGHAPSLQEYAEVRDRELTHHASLGPEQLREVATGEKSHWMPHPVTVRNRFDTWTIAIKDLKKKYPRKVKRLDVLFLQELIMDLGHPISEKEYEVYRQDKSQDSPHASSLIRGFGSWPSVLEAAGSRSTHYSQWDAEQLIGVATQLANELGRVPTIEEYEIVRKIRNWPTFRQFQRHYADWPEVKAVLEQRLAQLEEDGNLKPNTKTQGLVAKNVKKDGIEAIVEYIRMVGRAPTLERYKEERANHTDWPSPEDIRSKHEGWKAACRKAWNIVRPLKPPSEVYANIKS